MSSVACPPHAGEGTRAVPGAGGFALQRVGAGERVGGFDPQGVGAGKGAGRSGIRMASRLRLGKGIGLGSRLASFIFSDSSGEGTKTPHSSGISYEPIGRHEARCVRQHLARG